MLIALQCSRLSDWRDNCTCLITVPPWCCLVSVVTVLVASQSPSKLYLTVSQGCCNCTWLYRRAVVTVPDCIARLLLLYLTVSQGCCYCTWLYRKTVVTVLDFFTWSAVTVPDYICTVTVPDLTVITVSNMVCHNCTWVYHAIWHNTTSLYHRVCHNYTRLYNICLTVPDCITKSAVTGTDWTTRFNASTKTRIVHTPSCYCQNLLQQMWSKTLTTNT